MDGTPPDPNAAAGQKPTIKVRLIRIRLTNRGDKDITAFAALTQMRQGRKHPNVFVANGRTYIGVLRDFRDPTVAVMLAAEKSDDVGHMIAPSAGWNSGLIGVRRGFTVKAGRTGHVTIVFVSVAEKAKSGDHSVLKAAMDRIDDRIRKAVSGS